MQKKRRLLQLSGLAVMEKEMSDIYRLAISNVNIDELRGALRGFHLDHETRFNGISAYARRMDGGGGGALCVEGIPEMYTGGLKPIDPDGGTRAALETILEDELFVRRVYEIANGWQLGAEGDGMIRESLRQEDAHLKILEEAVRKKVWESFIVPLR